MVLLFFALSCIAIGVGTGILVSRKNFEDNISEALTTESSPADADETLATEIERFKRLKENLIIVKKNVEDLDIPVPESLTNWDDTESSLNKLSAFFEKHSKSTVGTEAFILSILPVSQTGEALCSFASIAPDLFSNAFTSSVAALKEGMTIPGIDNITTCLEKFCDGMAHTSNIAIGYAVSHHDYMGALLQPVKSGLIEMSGLRDAAGSLSESIHDISDVLGNAAENSFAPTDFTDLDFSGHIPIITIAISSFREFSLLMDDKTNALTSLKNIGLDVAGTGGGGLVGAKTGALAGSVFGPVGMLIGGIVGGIVGAMGGRALTNDIKQKPLKNAIEAYQINAEEMKEETKAKSRLMLQSIRDFSTEKRREFKDEKMLRQIPVVDSEVTFTGVALIMYQAIIDHIESMKQKVQKMRSSIWFSENKYGDIVVNYEDSIAFIERQLPPLSDIESNSQLALETILSLQIPKQKTDSKYQRIFRECSKELKEMNDKNNSSVLVWSYLIDGLYQKTLNEIANYSNSQMTGFNQFVSQWRQKLSTLENTVNCEKEKLGHPCHHYSA